VCTSKLSTSVFCFVPEGPHHHVEQICEEELSSASTETVPDSIFDRSRMSLIQVQQVRSCAVYRAGKLDCLGVQIPCRGCR